jgi:hypothetical protein
MVGGTPASSTTKTGRHDIADILLKVALNTINQIKSNQPIKEDNLFKVNATPKVKSFIHFLYKAIVLTVDYILSIKKYRIPIGFEPGNSLNVRQRFSN